MDVSKVTRIEIVDHKHGKVYVGYGVRSIEYQLQDEGRTLKLFTNYPKEPVQLDMLKEDK